MPFIFDLFPTRSAARNYDIISGVMMHHIVPDGTQSKSVQDSHSFSSFLVISYKTNPLHAVFGLLSIIRVLSYRISVLSGCFYHFGHMFSNLWLLTVVKVNKYKEEF